MKKARFPGLFQHLIVERAKGSGPPAPARRSWRVATGEIAWSSQLYRIYEIDRTVRATPALLAARAHPDDLPSLQLALRTARSGRSDFRHEHRLLMPDSSVKYLRMAARPTRDRNGRIEYVGAIQDVTPLRPPEGARGRTGGNSQ